MPGAAQADRRLFARALVHAVPLVEGQRPQQTLYPAQIPVYRLRLAADGQLKGVLQHDRQQLGAGLAAIDRPVKTGGQQPGNTPHMIEMHMGDHQRPDVADIEFDFGAPGIGTVRPPVTALKQAAIDQQPRVVVQRQFVA